MLQSEYIPLVPLLNTNCPRENLVDAGHVPAESNFDSEFIPLKVIYFY